MPGPMGVKPRGLTLVEMMITLVLLALVLVALVPLTSQWFGRSKQNTADCALPTAIDMTRSLALRNLPADPGKPAALLCLTPTALNLYRGNALPASCPTTPDAQAVWSLTSSTSAPFVSAGRCYALDSAGRPLALAALGSTACDSALETTLAGDSRYANCRFK